MVVSRKFGNDAKSALANTQRPSVVGRGTRKEKKNPFSGYAKQNYDEIVKKCKASGTKFEDPEFPAEDASICFSKKPDKVLEWKRPFVSEIYHCFRI